MFYSCISVSGNKDQAYMLCRDSAFVINTDKSIELLSVIDYGYEDFGNGQCAWNYNCDRCGNEEIDCRRNDEIQSNG